MTVPRVECHLEELKTYSNVAVRTNCNIIIVARSIAPPLLLHLVGAAVCLEGTNNKVGVLILSFSTSRIDLQRNSNE